MPKGYKVIQRKPFHNKSNEVYYRESVQNLLDAYIKSYIKDINDVYPIKTQNTALEDVMSLFKNSKLNALKKHIKTIVNKFINRSSKVILKSIFNDNDGKDYNIHYNKDAYEKFIKIAIQENVKLITNLTEESIEKVNQIVFDNARNGINIKGLKESLLNANILPPSRIKLIAQDQCNKLVEQTNMFIQKQSGVEYFQWDSSHDNRVRPDHKVLNGKIYKYNDTYDRLPLIDSRTNTHGYCGEAIRCRCTALAVYLDDGFEAKWNNSTKSYDIVKNNDR